MSTDDTAREASRQAGQFRRLRSAHQVELAEDYVELAVRALHSAYDLDAA